MAKIASSLELQGELQRILRLASASNPSRDLLSGELQALAARLARSSPETRETYKVKQGLKAVSKKLPSLEAAVREGAEVLAKDPKYSDVTIHKSIGIQDDDIYWLMTIKEQKQLF